MHSSDENTCKFWSSLLNVATCYNMGKAVSEDNEDLAEKISFIVNNWYKQISTTQNYSISYTWKKSFKETCESCISNM